MTMEWIGGILGAAFYGVQALALGGGQPLAMAIVWLTVIGAAGMTYGVLMAHARGFFPDHLLGRGITMMNFLLIGGAGLLQIISGRLVEYLRTAGWSSADVYACLHGAFALALLATTLIYLLSRDNK